VSDSRLPVPDPALLRRAYRRMVIALVGTSIPTAFLTVAGIVLVVSGDLPGLPLAAGGLVLLTGAALLVASVGRVRRSLNGPTVARSAVLTARAAATAVRRTAELTCLALLVFGLVRVAFGDFWSLITGAGVAIAVWFLARGCKSMADAQDRALTTTG
jgi:hypothetical protein